MASKTIPTPVLGALVGLLGFITYKIVKAAGSPFTTTSGVRFWRDGEKGSLTAALGDAHVAPTIDAATGQPIARVMTVLAGAGTPADNALGWVRKVQGGGHVVTASENLLDKSAAKRLLADVLPAEEGALASAVGVAVLPLL